MVVQEIVEALAGLGAQMHALVLAAVMARDDPLRGELLVHAVRVRPLDVHLVDGDDDRDLGRPGVVDGLDGLRLDSVVGGDNEHHQVGDLRAACTHGSERFVAGSVYEDDWMTVGRLDLVRADALGDAAGLARRDPWSCGSRRGSRSCHGRHAPGR